MEKKKNKKETEIIRENLQLPHSDELERDVLGSILMLGENCLDEIGDYLKPNTFYNSTNAEVYHNIEVMHADGMPISLLNLAEFMRKEGTLEGCGGTPYLASLSRSVTSTTNIVTNAKLLMQYECGRRICEMCEAGIAQVTSYSDVDEVIEGIERGLTEMQAGKQAETVSMQDALTNYYKHIKEMAFSDRNMYISTGLRELDKVLCGGFHDSDLIVFGGRPGNGKTQLSLQFARKAAEQGRHVLFLNIEMTTNNLIGRMASNGISYDKLRTGKLNEYDFNQLESNMSELMQLPIEISSDCNSFSGILSMARRVKRKQGLDMLIIDYLQLIDSGVRMERRQLEIGYMTRRFKALAKELGVPILLLSQLNRPSRGEDDMKPRLESLRESGDIEQDADIVLFTHRPIPKSFDQETGRSWKGRGMIVVAKNREGERDVDVKYAHDPYFKVFVDDGDDDPEWKCGDTSLLYKGIDPNKDSIGAR